MAAKPLRVPMSVASTKGVSWLADTAAEQRVILTRFGSPHAVVDSAERLDADAVLLRDASRAVVDNYADRAGDVSEFRSLDEVCSKLGLDPERVRARAAELQDE